MTKVPEEVFAEKRLDKTFHARLLIDLDRFAETAGIPPVMVWSRLNEFCSPEEVDWVRHIKQSETVGMVFVGAFGMPVEDKMMAIAGACLRNYIDARVMSVQDVIVRIKEQTMPNPSVLLIPNFCLEKGDGGDIAQWNISSLLGLLLSRLSKNLKTVLYVGSMAALEKNYGESFRKHIASHYQLIQEK